MLSKEFEETLRKITMLGYGLVLISHVDVRRETIDNSEKEYYAPALNKRCYPICNRIVDIIGYIDITWNEDGTSQRWLYTRKTPSIMAGSRFKYLKPKIPFGYQELVDAITDAINEAEAKDGAVIVDKVETKETESLDYNAIRAEASELWTKLTTSGATVEENTDMAARILKRVEMIFGHPKKLSEITEDQVDLFNLVLIEMRDLAKDLK